MIIMIKIFFLIIRAIYWAIIWYITKT